MKSEEDSQSIESIEYCRTIVPSSMRSPYWKYFGFPSDNANNILTKQKIICTLCNTAIAYNKNTSNLRTHLIAKHCQLLHELQLQQQQHGNTQSGSKRSHSEVAIPSPTSDTCLEKRAKDNSYNFSSASTGVCIETDYKRPALIVEEEENDDIVELVEPVQQAEDLSDMDGVDFAHYAPYQPIVVLEETHLKQEHADEKSSRDADDAYAFVHLAEDDECQETTNAAKFRKDLDLEGLVFDMLIADILPLSTIEGPGLTRLISQLGHFSKTSVELKLVATYDKMFETISGHLKHICETQPYSLGVEINKNVDNMCVAGVYVNYYSIEENKILSVLFRNVVMSEEFAICNKSPEFESIFKELNLSKCSAAVLKGSHTFVETFFGSKGIPIVPCLESVLARCLFSIFELHRVKTEFNSVLNIAESAHRLGSASLTALPEVYPLCAWSKLNFLQSCTEDLKCIYLDSSVVLDRVRELIDYICPLKVTLQTIADEPLSPCSLMRPLTLRLMEEHFCANFVEEDYLYEIQQILTDALTNSLLKNTFLNEATFFDGRFRRDFLSAEDVAAIKTTVCERLKPAREMVDEPVKDESSSSGYAGCGNRKSSLKSFFQRNTEAHKKSTLTKKMLNIEYQFNKYNCEPALDLEQCPISWWQENCYTFKELKQVADHYLSVPCCVNRLFKQSVSERNELQNKRFMLRQQNGQKIWYLHYNKDFYDSLSGNKHCFPIP